jgi:ABC-type glycerol-3-phosphate transport system substrate-binding protein
MKNLFKFGFLALVLSLSVAACSSEKTGDASDSTMTDTTMSTMDTTTTMGDSTMVDSTVADTTKM